jgi:transcription elongation factor GreA
MSIIFVGDKIMYDELTEIDIKKMKDEIEYRKNVLRPKLSQALIDARELGDLSENAEYHCAKRDKGQNEGRITFLENMIRTAKIIKVESKIDEVGLFDKVTIFEEDSGDIEELEISTTTRIDCAKNVISKESPFGRAVLGHKVGDRILIEADDDSYYIVIKSIKKGCDDDSIPLNTY